MIQLYDDYELLYMYYQKDEEAERQLILKYDRVIQFMVHKALRQHRPNGVDIDELYQEGLIALLDAVNTFREEMNVPFYCFACLCIERSLKTHIKKYTRGNPYFFYNCVSLDMSIQEADNLYLYDVIADPFLQDNLFFDFDGMKAKQVLEDMHNSITQFEYDVVMLRAMGYGYQEIASTMQTTRKKVDNTIHRARKKLAFMKE